MLIFSTSHPSKLFTQLDNFTVPGVNSVLTHPNSHPSPLTFFVKQVRNSGFSDSNSEPFYIFLKYYVIILFKKQIILRNNII